MAQLIKALKTLSFKEVNQTLWVQFPAMDKLFFGIFFLFAIFYSLSFLPPVLIPAESSGVEIVKWLLKKEKITQPLCTWKIFSLFDAPVYFYTLGVPTFEKVWSPNGSKLFQSISMVAWNTYEKHILFYKFFSTCLCFIKKCCIF